MSNLYTCHKVHKEVQQHTPIKKKKSCDDNAIKISGAGIIINLHHYISYK